MSPVLFSPSLGKTGREIYPTPPTATEKNLGKERSLKVTRLLFSLFLFRVCCGSATFEHQMFPFFCLSFLATIHGMRDLSFPTVTEPGPLQWKCRILTSGLPAHSLVSSFYNFIMDSSNGASGKEPACQYRRYKRCRFNPWPRKIPWRRT